LGSGTYTLVGFFIISALVTQYAFALEETCPDCKAEGTASSSDPTLDPPITVSTDKSTYDHSSTIFVNGKVTNPKSGTLVTLTVIDPTNNLLTIDQLSLDTYGNFNTLLSTAGNLWKYDGTYTIRVQYGSEAINNKVFVELTGGITPEPTISEPTLPSITLSTDRTSYSEGDTIRISGNVGTLNENPNVAISMSIFDPIGEYAAIAQASPSSDGSYSFTLTAGGTMQITGNYEVIVIYGAQKISTTFYFVGTTETHPACGKGTIFDPKTNSCILESTTTSITVSTDRTAYNDGDPIRISGKIQNPSDSAKPVTLIIVDPVGDTASVAQVYLSSYDSFSHTEIAGGTMQISGYYTITAQYGLQKATTTFYFSAAGTIPAPTPFDTVPPLLLTPSDMTIDASDSSGARVDYSVKAIDDNDGILRPNCSPSSGSLFKIGETTVTCSATDSSGNSDRKSFLITVNPPDVVIPSWVKDVAGFWCGDEIDDISFIEAIQYLINNDVIIVPATVSSGSGAQEIPNWIKSNACWWSQGLITNSDFASGLQYLIGQGIIRV